MRPRAEARFSASTITRSSIRLSFVGAQVGCRTKMSRPRTFCWISTIDLAVGEAADRGIAEADVQVLAISSRERGIGVAGEDGHALEQPSAMGATRRRYAIAGSDWLGRKGSNLRMPESKSGALPLGDSPANRLARRPAATVTSPSQRRQRMLRGERDAERATRDPAVREVPCRHVPGDAALPARMRRPRTRHEPDPVIRAVARLRPPGRSDARAVDVGDLRRSRPRCRSLRP